MKKGGLNLTGDLFEELKLQRVVINMCLRVMTRPAFVLCSSCFSFNSARYIINTTYDEMAAVKELRRERTSGDKRRRDKAIVERKEDEEPDMRLVRLMRHRMRV